MKHGDTAVERERYNERSHQLDENEATAKEQYDNNHCEEVTGLSSDGYRHQVIEDYTHEQMAGNRIETSQDCNYWEASAKEVNDAASAGEQNAVQNGQENYWEAGGKSEGVSSELENGNEKSNEASC